jgi:hypothetical protein
LTGFGIMALFTGAIGYPARAPRKKVVAAARRMQPHDSQLASLAMHTSESEEF